MGHAPAPARESSRCSACANCGASSISLHHSCARLCHLVWPTSMLGSCRSRPIHRAHAHPEASSRPSRSMHCPATAHCRTGASPAAACLRSPAAGFMVGCTQLAIVRAPAGHHRSAGHAIFCGERTDGKHAPRDPSNHPIASTRRHWPLPHGRLQENSRREAAAEGRCDAVSSLALQIGLQPRMLNGCAAQQADEETLQVQEAPP